MKKAIILGSGGHAKVIHSFIHQDYASVDFFGPLEESTVWASPENYKDIDFYLGIGDNSARTKVFNKLKDNNLLLPVCVGPQTFIAKDVKIGQGTFIGAGSMIMASSQVGENVIINTHSSVDHDCQVGDHSQITAGVTLGGNTVVGTNCFLGVRSATLPGINIGNNVQIMAGSLVTKDVAPNLMVGGYPAKVIKSIE